MPTNLLKLMKSRKVSQYKLAKVTNISPAMISYWVRGLHIPGTDIIEKAANYFGVTVDYLLDREEKEPPNVGNDVVKPIDAMEREIMEMLNQLTEQEKKLLIAQIKGILRDQK